VKYPIGTKQEWWIVYGVAECGRATWRECCCPDKTHYIMLVSTSRT
jgi:hypothetical protein